MALTVKATGGDKKFELVPAGTMIARCFSIIDLGTTWDEKYSKDVSKVRITWETSKLMSDGRPFVTSKTYTASVHEKSLLRKDIESIFARKLTEEELKGFHIGQLLNTMCMLQVVHAQSGEKTYANIQTIMAFDEGMARPLTPVNEDVFFEFTDDKLAVATAFDRLQDWQKDLVSKSKEYQAMFGGASKPNAVEVAPPNHPDKKLSFEDATALYNSVPEDKRKIVLDAANVKSFFELTYGQADAVRNAPF